MVLETGSAVILPWLASTHTLLETWYPGEDAGAALLAVLTGRVGPSGKLPVTFPASPTAMPAGTAATFGGVGGHIADAEGVDVGYRWYDANRVTPAFPFGYGLTYTSFGYSHLAVTPVEGGWDVGATVTDTGPRAGTDVAQLYVGDPAPTDEPPRQLRGFRRVTLTPGASRWIVFHLDPGDLAVWDATAGTWRVAPGGYTLSVGDSSAVADLPLHTTLALRGGVLGANSGPGTGDASS